MKFLTLHQLVLLFVGSFVLLLGVLLDLSGTVIAAGVILIPVTGTWMLLSIEPSASQRAWGWFFMFIAAGAFMLALREHWNMAFAAAGFVLLVSILSLLVWEVEQGKIQSLHWKQRTFFEAVATISNFTGGIAFILLLASMKVDQTAVLVAEVIIFGAMGAFASWLSLSGKVEIHHVEMGASG